MFLRVTAEDLDGFVRAVEFFVGSNQVERITAPPFSITISNLALGNYPLRAIAIDDLGTTATSQVLQAWLVLRPPALLQTVKLGSGSTGVALDRRENLIVTCQRGEIYSLTQSFETNWMLRAETKLASPAAVSTSGQIYVALDTRSSKRRADIFTSEVDLAR
jgi:hypothetical protein